MDIETEIIDPDETLLTWISSLSESARKELAFLSLYAVPDTPLSDDPEVFLSDPVELLKGWLEKAKSKPNAKFVGHILALIECIEFFVIAERGTKEDWDKIRDSNEWMKEDLQSQGHSREMIEPLEKIRRESQFREKQWISYAKTWRRLREGQLSSEYLKLWLIVRGR